MLMLEVDYVGRRQSRFHSWAVLSWLGIGGVAMAAGHRRRHLNLIVVVNGLRWWVVLEWNRQVTDDFIGGSSSPCSARRSLFTLSLRPWTVRAHAPRIKVSIMAPYLPYAIVRSSYFNGAYPSPSRSQYVRFTSNNTWAYKKKDN